MKKFFLIIFVIVLIIFIFAYNKRKENNLSDLFDEKSPNVTDTISGGNGTGDTTNNTQINTEQQSDINDPTSPDQTPPDNAEVFTHDEKEVQTIINRYIEAEDFYYTILYQRYDLDGYDIITAENSDGYVTQYHRVLYYDINSVEELRSYYTLYFTPDFVKTTDFNSYIEESGKLYCAQTENSSLQTDKKYIYTVESIDQNNCYVVKKLSNGTATQKIKAVKENGFWRFDSVAIA